MILAHAFAAVSLLAGSAADTNSAVRVTVDSARREVVIAIGPLTLAAGVVAVYDNPSSKTQQGGMAFLVGPFISDRGALVPALDPSDPSYQADYQWTVGRKAPDGRARSPALRDCHGTITRFVDRVDACPVTRSVIRNVMR